MKTKTLKVAAAMGLSALLVGSAAAQESASKPVGYETLTIANGFNYLGLRLHEAPVATGTITGVAADSISDDAADFTTLAAGTYVLEIDTADGIVQEVTTFTDGTTIPTDDLSGAGVDGASYTLRPVATLATVFGAANESGIDKGFGGTGGADQIWVPTPSGFAKYYYDEFSPLGAAEEWVDISTNAGIDPASVSLFYTDGVILVGGGAADNTFVVTGSVKLTASSYVLADGFNYLSSISPAGATLESMFGAANTAGLSKGFGGTGGADQVWIPSAGAFAKYYFDEFSPEGALEEWVNANDNTSVDPSTVSLDDASGIIIVNTGGAQSASVGVPSFYSTL